MKAVEKLCDKRERAVIIFSHSWILITALSYRKRAFFPVFQIPNVITRARFPSISTHYGVEESVHIAWLKLYNLFLFGKGRVKK